MNKSIATTKKKWSTQKSHFLSTQNKSVGNVPKKEEQFFEKEAFRKNPVQAKSENGTGLSQTAFSGKRNHTGLPVNLKSSSEYISGFNMSDVKVHYNSSEPVKIGALAYTQGNHIHLSSGQEKHLPHEAWHVIQQKQGRVRQLNYQYKNIAINNNDSLEQEADVMGKKLTITHPISDTINRPSKRIGIQQNIIQRKKVPTNFGEFETTKFAEADGRGVEIKLNFQPDASKVDAKKIALSQSLRKTISSGDAYAIDQSQASRTVATGKSGAGYSIDVLTESNNPLYGERNKLGSSQDLKDTPESANTTSNPVNLGVNTNYETGYCYKKNPADTAKSVRATSLWDKPRGGKNKGESKMFETAALAIDGTDKDKYYGSVKWGYKMEGTDAAPTVTKIDITEASKGNPTANFIEPAKLWNAGKTRGTLIVTADPEATVLKGDSSGTEKLTKDKKLKQLGTVMWGTAPAVKAEVLKSDGTGSGKIVYIKNSDVKDAGDGTANKKLPIP